MAQGVLIKSEREKIQEQLDNTRLALEVAKLQREHDALTGRVRGDWIDGQLLEGGDPIPVMDYPHNDNYLGDWRLNHYGMVGSVLGAQLGDRAQGENPIIFRNEIELTEIRAIGRTLADTSDNAQCVLNNLISYVVGTGYTYKAVASKRDSGADALVDQVQRCIDEFVSDNLYGANREEELFRRARRDGEYFLALYHVGNGRVQSRIIEPEQVTTPLNEQEVAQTVGLMDRALSYSYGVVTPDCDLETPLGYHVVWRNPKPHGRDTWQWFPESRMVHCKLNVDCNIKRGISDFFSVYEKLVDAAKLLRNTTKGHAIMSAIAFIREHAAGVSKSSVESMRSSDAWSQYTQVTRTEGSRTRYTHRYQPGTVLDVPFGQAYKASPLAEQGVGQSTVFVEEAVLRVAGSRWCMPSFMVSGDTSNASYATALVSESPFVKYCQRQQKVEKFHHADVLWKVLKIAHAFGRFNDFGVSWKQLQQLVSVAVETPIVAARNQNEETNRRKILKDSGVLSLETWTAEEGYDFEQEQERGAKKEEPPNPFGMANPANPFPGGDQPGQPVEKDTHPLDKSGEQPFRGREQPEMAKYESRLAEAARLMWGDYPGLFESDEKWVTINGAPVKLDDSGNIVAGPAGMKGKKASEVRGGNKQSAPSSAKAASQSQTGTMQAVKRSGKKWVMEDGSELPKHVGYIPPAWNDVKIDADPNASLVATGVDAKGRRQSVYSESHKTKQAAAKFNRTREMLSKRDAIRRQNIANMNSADSRVREAASATALIEHTGIRPGSDRDTKAAKQAYGATTLRAEHVVKRPDGVHLQFTGKKGVELDIPITDPSIAKMVTERASTASNRGGKLFDVNDSQLRDYSHTLDGGSFKPKDFRTAKGTSVAIEEIRNMPAPKSKKEYKAAVRKVADRVSRILGNTPTVALQSYIDPTVFSGWTQAQ